MRDKLLSNYLKEKANKPFKWGDNDCILFVAKFIKKATGNDFYSCYGEYKSKRKAYEIIKENGSIKNMVSNALGEPSDNYRRAKRGDIVLMHLPDETLGIVDDTGERVACLSVDGLTRLPLNKASFIWSY